MDAVPEFAEISSFTRCGAIGNSKMRFVCPARPNSGAGTDWIRIDKEELAAE